MKVFCAVIVYMAFFILLFVAFNVLWSLLISDVFYYCSDDLGGLMLPPFVHDCCGDYWIRTKGETYAMYYIFLTTLFTLPIIPAYLIVKKR